MNSRSEKNKCNLHPCSQKRKTEAVADGSNSGRGDRNDDERLKKLSRIRSIDLDQLTPIGHGSFGKVYYYDQSTVIKCVGRTHHSFNEISFLSTYHHPNIPSLQYVIPGANGFKVCMQNCGIDLVEWLVRTPPNLTLHSLPYITNQLIDVLSFLESQDITHGDIKLDNILINPVSHHVYLCDWGGVQHNTLFYKFIKPEKYRKFLTVTERYIPLEISKLLFSTSPPECKDTCGPHNDMYALGLILKFIVLHTHLALKGNLLGFNIFGCPQKIFKKIAQELGLTEGVITTIDQLLHSTHTERPKASQLRTGFTEFARLSPPVTPSSNPIFAVHPPAFSPEAVISRFPVKMKIRPCRLVTMIYNLLRDYEMEHCFTTVVSSVNRILMETPASEDKNKDFDNEIYTIHVSIYLAGCVLNGNVFDWLLPGNYLKYRGESKYDLFRKFAEESLISPNYSEDRLTERVNSYFALLKFSVYQPQVDYHIIKKTDQPVDYATLSQVYSLIPYNQEIKDDEVIAMYERLVSSTKIKRD